MEMTFEQALRVAVFIGLFILTKSQEECQRGGCFPATGDLLVGRENKLSASSTCGLGQRERYCIVSFLDKNDKCFYCDSDEASSDANRRDFNKRSHLPKYVVTNSPQDRLKGWWQSQNGVQDVTIQLDLEVEFVFTHLIMTFKTFRPKAMYVERSWNYGKTWNDYRYFAFDCKKSFPNIQRGPQKKIDDVICEERYSKVEPSTEGEVVLKVLDPGLQETEDPYSLKVQNLLKLTNLRIHFKELHTFGDDVLGDSPEVNQKYYYALYEMVVRGSCSCYGHAEQCIPAKGTLSNVNMVHGNCDCKHNTTGRNCEKCKDGYNDEPWRPAYKDQLNVCRKCNCNGHTEKCHFDPAVYRSTGNKGGGVCDDCQHNTAGRQCEQCKPLYYRDPFRESNDPLICKPCDCDPAGSFGGGECETIDAGKTGGATVVGRCICKANVEGQRCDRCKDGSWNLLESNVDGCQSCNCDKRGAVERDTCNQKTGTCRCKRNVRGLTCSKCLEGYWNLGATPEGCEECGCDVGGSRNATCDDITGLCDCRPNIIGRKCNKVRPGYHFADLDHTFFEGENADPGDSKTPFKVIRKIVGNDEEAKWTGEGYVEVQEGSILDFNYVRVPENGNYKIVIRYDTQNYGEWTDVRVTVTKKDGSALGGNGCPVTDEKSEERFPTLPNYEKVAVLNPSICFEKNEVYKIRINFKNHEGATDWFGFKNEKSNTLIDSIVLLPDLSQIPIFQGRDGYKSKLLYENYNCQQYYIKARLAETAPEVCKKIQFSISSVIHNGGLPCNCDPVGTRANGSSTLSCEAAGGQCICKPGVIGRHCDKCAPGFYGFGHDGCKACECDVTGSKSQFCHAVTGECQCRSQIQGRKCDLCPPFYFGFPDCKPCQCNKHSLTCDQASGKCTNCRHNTGGKNCDVCIEGYYGDATQGTETDCQRCQCPGGSSGNQFSSSCIPVANGRVICNNCTIGYTGNQCEKCSDGYFGNPLKTGGFCKKCNCSGNIDPFADGKCDPVTGNCFNCINNAAGDHCEKCKPNYFGNALNQTCRSCVCNSLGTDSTKGVCDNVSGQCKCLKFVEGIECDKCNPGYYNLASGNGCSECNCDKVGSLDTSCNQLDGQCRCRVGFGGRTCGECEDFSWGNPKDKTCKACGCNPVGSASLQCDRLTAKCKCRKGFVGSKCDMCAPGTSGIMPTCASCHVCNDQWEDIVKELENKLENLLTVGGNFTFNISDIKLYSKEVQMLMEHLRLIEDMFRKHSVDSADIQQFRDDMVRFRKRLDSVLKLSEKYTNIVQNTTLRNDEANDELDRIELLLHQLRNKSKEFKSNVSKIIEGNIGGALNSTLDSLRRSRAAQKVVDESKNIIKESRKLRRKMRKEVVIGPPTFEELDQKNKESAEQLQIDMDDLTERLKELNRLLCGSSTECGGCTNTGCGSCGAEGSQCKGVKQLAATALKKAIDAKNILLQKKADAEKLLADVKLAEKAIDASKASAKDAEENAQKVKELADKTLAKIIKLIKDITDFLKEKFSHPDLSKSLAKETMSLNISLTPEEVKNLAQKIRKAVQNLTNVDKILDESENDRKNATKLKEEALRAKKFAIKVMNKTQSVLNALGEASKLQNKTNDAMNMTRAIIANVTDIINQIKAKIRVIEGDLSTATNDTSGVEKRRDDLKNVFKRNREKLGKAETKGDEAKGKVDTVKRLSGDVNRNYNQTKEKLNKMSLGDVLKRVKALDDGAVSSFQKATLKMTLLQELMTSYSRNEKRVKDLSDELRKLTIKAKYIRKRLQDLSLCHSACNPGILGDICQDALKKANAAEKLEVDQLNIELQSKNS